MYKHLGDRKNHGSRSKGVIWTAGEGGERRRGVWKDEEVEEEEKEREALPYSMLHRSSVFWELKKKFKKRFSGSKIHVYFFPWPPASQESFCCRTTCFLRIKGPALRVLMSLWPADVPHSWTQPKCVSRHPRSLWTSVPHPCYAAVGDLEYSGICPGFPMVMGPAQMLSWPSLFSLEPLRVLFFRLESRGLRGFFFNCSKYIEH